MAKRFEPDTELDGITRRFRPVLMAYLFRRLRNHAEAEDLTQEVFVRLAAQERLEMQAPEGYIFQIATNLLRDRSRRNRVRSEFRDDLSRMEGRAVDPLDPLRIAGDREALGIIRRAIAELPERTRHIFILARLENVERRTLAESYGISISTIDRELARALASLTSLMHGDGEQ
ncbi:RNA polymerase sigma factor [Sphingomonas quercus]|uniref:Sigma-70 family RNA polymerase sigma factor n=1 Tax=Sphingomonas quercus TaxID=2842451 RepID=A0ABS6BJR5_9SPHN|nr:sigma-70 family RNA polymerase sigma factor [Sphingomonas quercus]MBU3078071.1 sigma-70 family RNA polymerase sigma factor [Sphingomonas quercus]